MIKNIIIKIYNKIFTIKSEIFDVINKILKFINETFDNILLLRRKSILKERNKSNLKFKLKLKFNIRFVFLKTKKMKSR